METSDPTQALLDRIAEQATHNTYLPNYDTQELVANLDTTTLERPVGHIALAAAHDDDKFPFAEKTGADMEDTQEIPLPGDTQELDVSSLFKHQAVQAIVPVKPIPPRRTVVTLSEDPGRFPKGRERTRFTL